MYDEEYALEHALFPWLDDPSMECCEEPDFGEYDEPWYYCEHCDAGLSHDEAFGHECPECGGKFTEVVE